MVNDRVQQEEIISLIVLDNPENQQQRVEGRRWGRWPGHKDTVKGDERAKEDEMPSLCVNPNGHAD